MDLHRNDASSFPHLLQSFGGGSHRYDILFAYPKESLTLASKDLLSGKSHFLSKLNDWYCNDRLVCSEIPKDLPFKGGWFLFLAYELIAEIEPQAIQLPVREDIPVAFATRFNNAIIRRQDEPGIYHLISEDGSSLNELEQAFKRIKAPIVSAPASQLTNNIIEDSPDLYLDGVKRIKDYIRNGDIFQANLSRQWSLQLENNHEAIDADLYTSLCYKNPAPFAGLISHEKFSVMSSSPERLVSIKDGVVETRPIAGTRPRSSNQTIDKQLVDELKQHPKERAEHIMLIDLERNDLGRVCKSGSVVVDELMTIESYQHVHHIVSNIRGELKANKTPIDVIRAVFPGGTITGCPKVRCIQILAELENTPRHAYTGSVGYLNSDGSMDLNILIRSLLRVNNEVLIRAGAGIVADSSPLKELAETRAKATGMLNALTYLAQ